MKRVAQMTENLRENPPKSDDNSDIRGQLELLQNRLSELQAAFEQETQNRDLVERGGSNLTLARKKFAEGDFPMAQEKVKGLVFSSKQ